MNRYFPANTEGRDFVVGDVHGCFHMLEDALKEIGFNEEVDRLFSVGDLIDRGPLSARAKEWLHKPWFHAVRGNHEQMLIDVHSRIMDAHMYIANGGAWFTQLLPPEQNEYADLLDSLPLTMTVDKPEGGRIGILHAEWSGTDWETFIKEVRKDAGFVSRALWGRTRIYKEDTSRIEGVDLVFAGHTPLRNPELLGNTKFIDTGACFPEGSLTLCNLEGEVVSSIKNREPEKDND